LLAPSCLLAGDAVAEPEPEPDETIIIDDRAPRGGVADLVGPDAATRDRRRALASSSFLTIVHVDERAGETRGLAESVDLWFYWSFQVYQLFLLTPDFAE
jgi:hypothetical protein